MNLLVTGANGFLGSAILRWAANNWSGHLFGSVRSDSQSIIPDAKKVVVGDLSAETEWKEWLTGMNVVVHTAGRAHLLQNRSDESLLEFRRVNRDATLKLARECATAGVRRFIFISSIGVNGAETSGVPFSSDDIPCPVTPYALSKMEAEQGLWKIATQTGLEVVIIRPPLVYGPDAPGNFRKLLKFAKTGIPLPLGAVANKRSLVGIDNLVDLVKTCINHPMAPGHVFLVSDGMDVSTTQLLRLIGQARGKPVHLFSVPSAILYVLAGFFGMRGAARQLLGSLQVNILQTQAVLGWKPQVELVEGLRRATQ
ncbi:MAG: NAD-dependent epimerase/dehydratase family protein [Steroidobacteraceae bacterium]